MSKSSIYRYTLDYLQDRWDGDGVNYLHNVLRINYADSHWTSGTSLPGFRSLIKQRKNATTYFTGHLSEAIYSPVTLTSSWRTTPNGPLWKDQWVGTMFRDALPAIPYSGSVRANAERKLKKNILKEFRSVQALVFLGELHKTLRMLKSPFASIRDLGSSYLRRLKRSRVGSPVSRKKALANAWLELQFGWKPLISDINGILRAAARVQEGRRFTTVTSSDESFETLMLNNGSDFPSGTLWHKRKGFKTTLHSTRMKAGLDMGYEGGNLRQREMDQLGINLIEFIPTAWELLPWSFLVDYFTTIGDVVNSIAIPYERVAWTWRTSKYHIEEHNYIERDDAAFYAMAGPSMFPVSYSGGNSYPLVLKRTDFERDSVTLSVSTPELSVDLSPIRIANIAALLAGRHSLVPYY